MTKIKKTIEKQKLTESFNTNFICAVLKEKGIIDDEAISQIKLLEQEQYKRLQSEPRNNGISPITPVDVISSMKLKVASDATKFVTEEVIMKALAAYWKLPFLKIEMSKLKLSSTVTSKISEPFARKHLVIPVLLSKTMLLVAILNPWDVEALDTVRQISDLEIRPVISTKTDILKAIDKYYGVKKSQIPQKRTTTDFRNFVDAVTKELPQSGVSRGDAKVQFDESYTEKHIVNAVNSLLQYAFEHGASDIHIEPKRTYSMIRLRIDGILHEFDRIPHEIHNNFIVRLKALAGMHIADKRKPQDGRFQSKFRNKNIEFRLSTIPVVFGEKMMIRVLDSTMLLQNIDTLGFSDNELTKYMSLLSSTSGIILVTGPTGSGKTTTIYSTLNTLSDRAINITTIEDPIELVNENFNQIELQPAIGLTFGTAIRHIVRQSADVIMVGEIRDEETVENAFNAALTGHIVISTLHTNDAPSTIVRLTELGAHPSLIESTLIAVVAQRLVRKVCDNCAKPYALSPQEMTALLLTVEEVHGLPLRKGVGCEHCQGTGYLGRTAIFEIMVISNEIRTLIHNNAAAHLMKSVAIKEGMRTLRGSAIAKFKAGITTSEEVFRIMGGVF